MPQNNRKSIDSKWKNKTKQNIKSQHAIKEDFTKWKYALLLGGEANTVKAQFSLNQCAGSI